jgi:hypothetical protein
MGFTGKGRELQKSNSWFFCREKYGEGGKSNGFFVGGFEESAKIQRIFFLFPGKV